jgi:ribonucleoside-diphosphate reductase alpha chain
MSHHLKERYGHKIPNRQELEEAVLSLQIMPSMRALMTAGLALERDHTSGYNCSYIPVDSPRSFDEILYVLMCGTGVGFSAERQYTESLPSVNEHFEPTETTIVVQDSKAGWARGLRELIACLYAGQVPQWDLSRLRPAGARLKTFGGRSSGPAPLDDLLKFTVALFKNAAGRQLSPLECHDLVCKIASVIVVGGVRRSALISLSDLNSNRMRVAKSGEWFREYPHRGLANNSAVYSERPDMNTFLKEWYSLYESKSGERGIFNRESAQNKVASIGRRDPDHVFGTNPCSEIILRPYQFCNLTEVVVRAEDTVVTLTKKIEWATQLGTYQSSLTDFKYLRKIWKQNTEEERLLGVSLTGILDNEMMSSNNCGLVDLLVGWRKVAVKTNDRLAKSMGINPSTAITCVKPSGTVSQLVDSASGIHPRHSEHYIRTVRGDNKDPLTQFMIQCGIPSEPAIGNEDNMTVFSFPVKSPKGALTRDSLTAIEHLELWKTYAENWCEHKPSITISVKEHEWLEVGDWVYKNFDYISGVSFLPHSDHAYQQAPYTECSKEEYESLVKKMPETIKWEGLKEMEIEDTTTGSQELSCTGEVCEVVDIGV